MLLLRNADVQKVLDMPRTVEALRVGYADLSRGDAAYVPRIDMYAPTGRDSDYYRWGCMSGVCRSFGVVATRIKSDVVFWSGGTEDKYCMEPGTYSGIILLYGISNGEPLAIIQDGYLQHMRVGASAGIGAQVLARSDATVMGLLGSGGMARTFLEAIALVRPLSLVRVFSPTASNRESFAAEMSRELGIDVQPVTTAEEAVASCDIVATATDSTEPTFDSGWLAPGTTVLCVSRRELGRELLDRADRTFQLGISSVPYGANLPGMEWPLQGKGAYITGTVQERARIPRGREAERVELPLLTDVLGGASPGRTNEDEVIVFMNGGTQGLQFAAVAGATLQQAVKEGIGHVFPTEWFLQDIRD